MILPGIQPPAESIRLAHFSDIHLTATPLGWRLRDLLTKRVTGWTNLKIGRGRRFRNAEAMVRAMMSDLRARACHRVIFSGDATTMGFESEFIAAARCLSLAPGPPELPGIAVPGNHDYYIRRAQSGGYFERYFEPWQHGERIDGEVYPFAQRVGHCWLIGVNSARSNFLLWDARGGIGPAQLERLRELLRKLSPGPRIIVTHYPLYLADGTPEHRWRRLRSWKNIQKVAAEGGIALWLNGHRHTGYVLPPNPPEQPFPIICAGSATQRDRWSWNEYSIARSNLTLRRRTWNPSTQQFVESETRELQLIDQGQPG
jgi:3',5'-cyclic AMP phosphodiesterase CpdA